MANSFNLEKAMNNISLDDEEEGGLIVEEKVFGNSTDLE